MPEHDDAGSISPSPRPPVSPSGQGGRDGFPPSEGRQGGVEISIVIPCRNEEGTIGACVREARTALAAGGYVGEVVVCDNGSTDDSVQAAEAAGATVVYQPIPGYGAACLRGFEAAQGELLVIVDGDGTYEVSRLNRFVEPLRAGYDLVLGTRRNGRIHPRAMRKRHRQVLEPIQTFLSRRMFALRVSDVRCGFRGIRREALDRLNLGATGMEFASEMLIQAQRAGCESVEVPVDFRPRPLDEHRRSMGDGWRVVRQFLLLSPTRLFLIPGLILMALGLGLEAVLMPGPLRFGAVTLDYHFMFVGGLVAILGEQLTLLGIYAKTWALVEDAGPDDPWIRRFHIHYTLERGVALGGLLFGGGLSINVWILAAWLMAGHGMLFAVRPATLALTLMVLGAEIIFASFFLSVLRGTRFGRV